jgi:hypothetical protein
MNLLLILTAIANAIAIDKDVRLSEDIRRRILNSDDSICDGLSKSLTNPIRCKDNKLRKEIDDFARTFKANNAATNFDPVVFIPGFAASGLDGYLDERTAPAWYIRLHMIIIFSYHRTDSESNNLLKVLFSDMEAVVLDVD